MKDNSAQTNAEVSPRYDTLYDWLSWLETLHPKEIDLGLERTRLVADRLGLLKKPSNGAQLITVAGTNGKGSFVTSIQALLKKGGAKVGAYTSPHILEYNERIQIDGKPVSDNIICRAFQKIDSARLSVCTSDVEISLSYFEFATLAALIIFEDHCLDFWVLEVGLGGRLDATNIMDADIAVITSIAIDHQGFLGSTRELIAVEKAGIIRHGATVICADIDPPQSLTQTITEKAGGVYFLGKDFVVEQNIHSLEVNKTTIEREPVCRFVFFAESIDLDHRPNLPLASVAAALKAYELVCDHKPNFKVSKKDLRHTLQNLSLPGRFERVVCDSVSIILDVAHNPAAAQHLVERLKDEGFGIAAGKKPISCVVAMMDDKDIESSLLPIMPFIQQWFCSQIPNLPRSMASKFLSNKVQALLDLEQASVSSSFKPTTLIAGECFDHVLSEAVCFAKTNNHDLLVFGSFYTVTEAKKFFNATDTQVVKSS